MKNVQLNLLIINPIAKPDAFAGDIKKYLENVKFHKIFSFDMKDSEEYGFEYTPCIYSKLYVEKKSVIYDFLFIGKDKGRLQMLDYIFRKTKSKGYNNKPELFTKQFIF